MYYKYSDFLKKRYGQKVYKIPVNLPLTCPNRDGTIGVCGCSFCADVGTGFESLPSDMPIVDQIENNIAYIGKKYKSLLYIIYFQNFSNTYMPLQDFKKMLKAIPKRGDIVGVSISTRPDLIREDYLKAAEDLGIDIYFELGLQSVNYKTLKKINRGHTLAEFIDSVYRIKQHGFFVCAHVILNLPWDDLEDVIECAKIVSALRVDLVKLHSLYIMQNTALGDLYQKGEIKLISCDEYIERIIIFLEYLKKDIAVERLISRAPQEGSLFVNWGIGSYTLSNMIEKQLENENCQQGKKCNYLGGQLLEKFD